jgi:RNase P subunit RPR2
MTMRMVTKPGSHKHAEKRVHVIVQRAGIPYEIERVMCDGCRRVLSEKPVQRARA